MSWISAIVEGGKQAQADAGAMAGGLYSIYSGLTSTAPKISPPKAFARNLSTPEYSIKKGVLTQNPSATSSQGYTGIFGNLGQLGQSFAGLRPGLANVGTNLNRIGGDLSALRGEVRPGFGRLTEARVQSIKNAAAESIGDLRTQLQRRSVLGSSFGQDTETRARLAFGQAEEQARAQAIIEEIGTSVEIAKAEIGNQAAILGLNEEERATIQNTVMTNMAQAQILSTQIGVELQKLGITADWTKNLNALLMGQAINQAQMNMAQQTMNAANIGYGISSVVGGSQAPANQGGGGGGFGGFGGMLGLLGGSGSGGTAGETSLGSSGPLMWK